MRKYLLAVGVLVLLTMALLLSTPAPTEATNCLYGYQYCSQYYCAPDDEQCQLGCECSYLACIGAEQPSRCL
jgi:hypothetical protein